MSGARTIREIEDENACRDMGRMGYNVMKGAREEGASPEEAMSVMIGYFAGIAASNHYRFENEEKPDGN